MIEALTVIFRAGLALAAAAMAAFWVLWLVTDRGARSPREALAAWAGPLLAVWREALWEVPLRVATGRYKPPRRRGPVTVSDLPPPPASVTMTRVGPVSDVMCLACGRSPQACNCTAPWRRGGAVPPVWWVDARTGHAAPLAAITPVVVALAAAIRHMQALAQDGPPPRPQLIRARFALAAAMAPLLDAPGRLGAGELRLLAVASGWLSKTRLYVTEPEPGPGMLLEQHEYYDDYPR